MRITTLIGAVALTFTIAACGPSTDEATTDETSSMNDGAMNDGAMSDGAMNDGAMNDGAMDEARAGSFAGLNGKTVAGTVTVADGKVELSGFSSDEGPDLHLYLTTGDDAAAVQAGTSLGPVAFDEENQTFELDGVDAAEYDTVVIHCDKAKAVFGAASLS